MADDDRVVALHIVRYLFNPQGRYSGLGYGHGIIVHPLPMHTQSNTLMTRADRTKFAVNVCASPRPLCEGNLLFCVVTTTA